jgi:hypothetical protein
MFAEAFPIASPRAVKKLMELNVAPPRSLKLKMSVAPPLELPIPIIPPLKTQLPENPLLLAAVKILSLDVMDHKLVFTLSNQGELEKPENFSVPDPTVAEAESMEMVGGAVEKILNSSLALKIPSLAVTLTAVVADVGGVPEKVRVALLKLSQAGKAEPSAKVAV